MRFHFVLLFLFLSLIKFIDNHEWNGFDDTVLFKLNWPGPGNDDLLKTATDAEIMDIKTRYNEQFKCIIPKPKSKTSSQADDATTGLSPLDILTPLFTQKLCSYRLESYWTYELCHGRFIRQYHEEREGKKVKIQEYFLGKWDSDKHRKLKEKLDKMDADGEPMKYKKIDGLNLPYFEIEMNDGTMCDLSNKPRVTRMQYVCFAHGKHEVYSFKETSTCEYEVIILSSLLCSHPKFKPQDSGENIINCIPVGDAYKKPRHMLAMEAESYALRMQKMPVSKLGKDVVAVFKVEKVGQDGESRLKFELHPLGLDPLSKPSSIDEGNKFIQSSDSIPPLTDTSPVKSFLDGETCLNGGTGWWKYEFCYGKTVTQYHVDRSGSRQSVLLGKFDEDAHMAWIADNPQKRPKPKGPQRTVVSHFYSQGTVCDKTGNPRETEVKLKCLENSSSPGQVSLYLLEPKTCQYILSVESPILCDLLDLADENGIITVSPPQEDNEIEAEPESPAIVDEPKYNEDKEKEESTPVVRGDMPPSV